ncbi:MAG TPA: ATP-binding protein [Pyrinomonadaceae bacterium]|nr:ATP-binding protein [Pyrinomonadaceae bacterium]
MDSTLNQFIADAKDIVDRLYADLQQLRSLRAQGRHRRELASRIFRHAHTLKGSAGSIGLKNVSQLAHEFEGVLDAVRLGRITIDDSVLNLFEDTADAIAESIANSGRGDESASQALVARLHAVSAAASQQGTIAGSLRSSLPEDVSRSLSEYDLQHTREAVREGAKLFIVDAGFPIDSFDTQFRELTKLLGKTGEVISTIPGAASTAEEINFRLLYAAEIISDHIRSRATELGTFEFKEIPIASPDAVANAVSAVNLVSAPAVPSATSVRVGLNQLDELTSAVTDLLRDTTNALSALQNTATAGATGSTASDLRSRFVHLEERLIKLRLVPLSDLLNGVAARAGRVAARQLGRDIEFEIIGGNVGIDKSLADLVAEPLMHLVRNAVSHGIETPEERSAAGKSPNGSVRLQGFSEGSRIYIVVSDDGRGIDFAQVAEAATRQGIVSRPEDLTSDQALRLIFRPGFSTSPEATDISGRGVGLEIVDRAMTQAGGEVRLTSAPGKGATFAMMIPATLALVPCVVVHGGKQFYCFDSSIVADRVSLSEDQISPEAQQVEWQGENLRLLRMSNLLTGANGAPPSSPRAMLVCQPSEHRQALGGHQNRVAIAVDAIAGQQETLVRSLGPYSSLWHGISGAAEMLDGSVALMIDLARLIEANEG